MNNLINVLFFNDKNYNAKIQLFFAISFPFFTLLALGIDSVYFKEHFFEGRDITNVLSVLYFSFFFWFSDSYLRKLMFVMVFLSYLGEFIFCTSLEMYNYRTELIPIYVPFGHAIVFASGYVFAHTQLAVKYDNFFRKCFAADFYYIVFSCRILSERYFFAYFWDIFLFAFKKKKMAKLVLFHSPLCYIY
ncbi:hypothetical protein ACQ9BO_03960 [Flavobacterium sp. P21]|uniref:hypothetical protein n=1 Tax=Flavobacterium sp. P21 TaxID=3423948 RepID=UPI003D665495